VGRVWVLEGLWSYWGGCGVGGCCVVLPDWWVGCGLRCLLGVWCWLACCWVLRQHGRWFVLFLVWCLRTVEWMRASLWSSCEGHMVDVWASGADEGRGRLR